METAKREQQDWIERLLEYMDLSKDEMKKIIKKDMVSADAAQSIVDVASQFKTITSFFR